MIFFCPSGGSDCASAGTAPTSQRSASVSARLRATAFASFVIALPVRPRSAAYAPLAPIEASSRPRGFVHGNTMHLAPPPGVVIERIVQGAAVVPDGKLVRFP